MDHYVTGGIIRRLREQKGLTQKQLADQLCLSGKTISKWETARGLPDISLLEPLAAALGVSVMELLSGECIINRNRGGNILRAKFYVCPVCGNVIYALGEGAYSCCGIPLPPQEAEAFPTEPGDPHAVRVGQTEDDWYITMAHPMTKTHYISFFALAGFDGVQIKKLYPEQEAACRFAVRGHPTLFGYCNRHGLFTVKL